MIHSVWINTDSQPFFVMRGNLSLSQRIRSLLLIIVTLGGGLPLLLVTVGPLAGGRRQTTVVDPAPGDPSVDH
jgi:hypothetical protein